MNIDPNKAAPNNAAANNPSSKDPEADTKLQLQLAIFDVAKGAQGKSLETIMASRRSAFAARGVKSPPTTWLEAVASSASYGTPYIVDLPAAVAADAVRT
ncbi:hypothetical protein [Arthrobacter sp. efr-133-TYG-104]|uniref:hypothetical protein n=1 Tax=Arthrobacter sp. efr-133-TYG-104 TaxID=3040324 RepID=UPI00254D1414|nr:hypothetical protein [Arthrobacter sp. efr-133-TYG-104]